MIARIFRFDPSTDTSPYYKEYRLEVDPAEHVTVMALLERIADELDGSLSFYSHSACLHGICGRCAVRVNGKACLACQKLLDGSDVTIEPAGRSVVKDLVVMDQMQAF